MPNKIAGMEVVVGADISGVKKGMSDVKKELASAAVAAQKLDSSLGTGARGANQAANALTNVGRVAQDLPFGFIGIQNNLNPLLESFQRLKQETGSAGSAFRALGSSLVGAGGVGLALSVVSSAILIFQNGISGFNRKTKEAKEETQKLADSIKSVVGELAKEGAQVEVLVAQFGRENTTRKEKVAIINQLKKIAPEYFATLNTEKTTVDQLTESYNLYARALVRSIEVRLKEKELEKVIERRLELQNKGLQNVKEEVDETGKLRKSYNAVFQEQNDKRKIGFNSLILTKNEQIELNNLLLAEKKLLESIANIKPVNLGSIKTDKVKIEPKEVELLSPRSGILPQGPKVTAALGLDKPILVTPNIQFVPQDDNAFFKGLKDFFERVRIEQLAEEFSQRVSNTVNDILGSTGTSLGDAIADVLSTKGANVSNIFESLMSSVGQQVQELGKFLIQTGIQIKIAKDAFKKLLANPIASIAVGAGLLVLGGLLKAQAAKRYKGFAAGVRNFQPGGEVVDVGERGPERIFLPRGATVQPNNELNAYGGGQMVFIPAVTLRGQDLVVAFNRANQTISRNS